jgi:hypothetical protein
MSSRYVKAWEREGAVYRRMLDAAEDVLRRAVESRVQSAGEQRPILHPQITREHSDAPQVSVRWQSADGIDRAVHVDVMCDEQASTDERYSYGVAIAASHDDLHAGLRRWWYERPTTRAGRDQLSETVATAISAAQALGYDSLKKTAELLPLPHGLTAARHVS